MDTATPTITLTKEEQEKKERDRIRFKKYYQEHKAKYAEYSKAWWKAHPEKRREKDNRRSEKRKPWRQQYSKIYREKNREKVLKAKRDWQQKNREHRREYMKNYYSQNRESFLSKSREHYRTKKDQHIEQSKRWRAKNPDKVKKYQKKYRETHPTQCNLFAATRRALKRNATINLKAILGWQQKVKSKKTFRCYWCERVKPISVIHFDHIVPLVKGGAHSVENLCTSCATCNFSKNDRLITEWYRAGQLVLGL